MLDQSPSTLLFHQCFLSGVEIDCRTAFKKAPLAAQPAYEIANGADMPPTLLGGGQDFGSDRDVGTLLIQFVPISAPTGPEKTGKLVESARQRR